MDTFSLFCEVRAGRDKTQKVSKAQSELEGLGELEHALAPRRRIQKYVQICKKSHMPYIEVRDA